MAFSEKIKLEVKRLSHQSCCLCKKVGVEIHHIIPQSEQGSDKLDNAAPLCPSCHEIYGANPTKRKFIKESRDIWYEICASRFTLSDKKLEEILQSIRKIENQINKPINLDSNDNKEVMTFGQFIDFFNNFKKPTDEKQLKSFDIFYVFIFRTEGLGGNDSNFNELRDFFLKTFGLFLAEKVTLYLIDKLKLSWYEGIPEPILDDFFQSFELMMYMILMYNGLEIYTEKVGAFFNKNKQLTFTAIID